jgi:hypothetical protein
MNTPAPNYRNSIYEEKKGGMIGEHNVCTSAERHEPSPAMLKALFDKYFKPYNMGCTWYQNGGGSVEAFSVDIPSSNSFCLKYK